jgi:plasmid stabilization system protein ParE
MAKEIIWSFRAIQERKEIYSYWLHRNKSDTYSNKLDSIFELAAEFVATNPALGRPTQKPNVRVKVVRDYFLIYEIQADTLVILTISDNRRNPDKLIF